jgi:Flp pilus assembly protein TadB
VKVELARLIRSSHKNVDEYCYVINKILNELDRLTTNMRRYNMGIILLIGIVLLILWALGLFVFSLGSLVYIALVLAVILIIIWLLKAVFRLF